MAGTSLSGRSRPGLTPSQHNTHSMQRRSLLTLTFGFAAAAAYADQPEPVAAAAASIIELDRQLNEAIIAHDEARARQFYDDDFILSVAGGGIKRKEDMLADIRNPAVVLTVCQTSQVQVRVRGGTAVLTGILQQTGTVNGRPIDVKLNVTDTWVWLGGKWLLLAGHASLAR